MSVECWLETLLTLLAYAVTHSAAFVLGASWHHWHLDSEAAKAAGKEG